MYGAINARQHGYDDVDPAQQRRRGTMKWSACAPDVLAAWVAEMDFPLAAPIAAALTEAVERGCTGYPPPDALTGIPEALSDFTASRYGERTPADRVRLLPDLLRGVELAVELFSPVGSPVLIPTPSYPPFFEAVRLAGRRPVEVPVRTAAGRYELDLPAIDAALAAGAGTVILCNPHNPLGRVFSGAELDALAAVVARRGARVIADEVHAPLTYPGETFVPYASVSPEARDHSVTLTAASKGWNLPGLKCAQIVLTGAADVACWDGLSMLRTNGASTLGIAATVAAYRDGADWLDDTVRYLDGNRRLLADLLAQHLPEVRYALPAGTYLGWLDCTALGLADPAAAFLEHGKVAVNDGAIFGAAGQGCVRLNFATSSDLLTRIVAGLAAGASGAPDCAVREPAHPAPATSA